MDVPLGVLEAAHRYIHDGWRPLAAPVTRRRATPAPGDGPSGPSGHPLAVTGGHARHVAGAYGVFGVQGTTGNDGGNRVTGGNGLREHEHEHAMQTAGRLRC